MPPPGRLRRRIASSRIAASTCSAAVSVDSSPISSSAAETPLLALIIFIGRHRPHRRAGTSLPCRLWHIRLAGRSHRRHAAAVRAHGWDHRAAGRVKPQCSVDNLTVESAGARGRMRQPGEEPMRMGLLGAFDDRLVENAEITIGRAVQGAAGWRTSFRAPCMRRRYSMTSRAI